MPRYVWHVRQPDWANSFAPGTAFAGKPCFFTQLGTARAVSLASDSFAVAPL